jgi:uncharacterized delta-60 repeat protein
MTGGDGIIIAGSVVREDTQSDFAAVRLNADGSLDSSFDGDGKQTIGTPSREVGRGGALQSDGKQIIHFGSFKASSAVAIAPTGEIVVAGSWYAFTDEGRQDAFAVARLRKDGRLDNSFGDVNDTGHFGRSSGGRAPRSVTRRSRGAKGIEESFINRRVSFLPS